MDDADGYIYLLRDPVVGYKFGKTVDFQRRLSQYRSHNPNIEFIACKVVNDMDWAESELLGYVKRKRLGKLNVGNEWFELNPKAEKIWDNFWVDNPHFCNQEEEISTLGKLQWFFDIGFVLYSVYLLFVSPWWVPVIWIARFGIPMTWACLTNTKEDWEKLGVTEDTPFWPKLW
ncbi:GIY-YIG nuclease family protein [Pirellulales bacterium]|nr:GIY-YIG nuclease family protein [Pirellulales bacterium]